MPISNGALSWPKSYWTSPDSDAASSRNSDVTPRSDNPGRKRRILVRGRGESLERVRKPRCCRCWFYCPPWCCFCGDETTGRRGTGRDTLPSSEPSEGEIGGPTCWQVFSTYVCFRCEERDHVMLKRHGRPRLRRRRCCWCLLLWLCLLALLLLVFSLSLMFWLKHVAEDHPQGATECKGAWQSQVMVFQQGANRTCCYQPKTGHSWLKAIKNGQSNGLSWPTQGYTIDQSDCDTSVQNCDVILGIVVCDVTSSAADVTASWRLFALLLVIRLACGTGAE